MNDTVASLLTSSSQAPKEANPSSWENWAKLGLAKRGICPKSSWQQSLKTTNHYKNSKDKINLRFGSVERFGGVTNVLSAMEDSKSQSRKKVPRAEVTGNRSQLKAGLPFQKHADILQLRYIVFAVTAVFHKLRPVLQVLATRVLLIKFMQFTEHGPPVIVFTRRFVKKNLINWINTY